MSRLNELDIWYDEHTVLIGDAILLVDSFDDSNKERFGIDVENLSVVVFIGGIDYDVTKAFTEEQFGHFREIFSERVRGQHLDELKEGA